MPKKLSFAAAVILAAGLAVPAFAASTVMVTETGEGGSPMALKLDKTSVTAGEVIFKVHNDAVTENHEMVLVKLKSANEVIPLNAAKHRVDESKLKSLGEVADLKPGKDGQLKVKLAAGSYVLLCNIKGHYESGMKANFTVTPK